jgi:predicted membrane chloride channel (bestrophin family)
MAIKRKWKLTIRVLPLALAAVAMKALAHYQGWETITFTLFSGLLAATVFLLGFLLSGVLTDYKESEKLPGEIAASLDAITDQAVVIQTSRKREEATASVALVLDLTRGILDWFRGKLTTDELMLLIEGLNPGFAALEPHTPPNFLLRMQQEQGAIRRVIIRIDAIRRTSFISSGYAIAEIISTLLIFAFIFSKIEPFRESLFFVGLISFLLTYLLALIRDLDDPFEYGPTGSRGGDEVSLHPIEQAEARTKRKLEAMRQAAEHGAR